ncbi:type II toxin-antitoxin system VapB family antitoxin [Phormidium yuhuli AB48]|uniref:Type II toxin-antitoxin system VapB family antitoxin n=1 Tax=Phormidium yuhuli AB48 TaxID=2940671 RepID=A0ABY5ASN2_9CYAN|nr:ribbon-helix-helix protein, CopG family [Phormidium yuhuli]USR92030.1 type II toxin-antitoxin system VapB family antitoxin [Phormidium yuhuli AB48]
MKTEISIPDSVFEQAKALAQQLGRSRSELYKKALQDYLKRYKREQISLKLNQVYPRESSGVAPVIAKMQFLSFDGISITERQLDRLEPLINNPEIEHLLFFPLSGRPKDMVDNIY